MSAKLRAWRRIASVALLMLACLPLHGLWRLARLPSPWPRRFLGTAAWIAGAEVRVAGRPLSRDVLYVANHLSWLDILLIGGATNSRFVAKDEVRQWPLIGWLASLHATVHVARTERGRVHEQADRVRSALAEGLPVTLFPEGGTGHGHHVGPFRASLMEALLPPQPGMRLQPLAIDYEDAPLVAWEGDLSVGAEAMRLLGLPGRRRVTLHFLDPIDPVALPDRKALTHAAREAIRQALCEDDAQPV
ncbi:lysophospholipid acyltransferase family protein [Sphingomonas sp. PR090111-T3T-6A]|uniref:lysophospholipid acyltransferase family protein n=1 Tax=Sphingomonas sp. PR090111-T3T-6A TaxID=685778 RepID=UPI00035DF2C8|nr:lysophospholipid acyltransferase family protein [Sphingomonas sp. PR090111-T3T-6A]